MSRRHMSPEQGDDLYEMEKDRAQERRDFSGVPASEQTSQGSEAHYRAALRIAAAHHERSRVNRWDEMRDWCERISAPKAFASYDALRNYLDTEVLFWYGRAFTLDEQAQYSAAVREVWTARQVAQVA